MAKAVSKIDIGGRLFETASADLPSEREFRDAWVTNEFDQIEVDMVKARDIKIEKIVANAQERILKAEAKAARKALKGLGSSEEDADLAKFKSKPKKAGRDLITQATTPAQLDAITEDQVYA